jgi:hypothetical protein
VPKDFSPEATKGWLDIIPIAIDLRTHVYNSLTKEGYVASGANLPQMPKLDDPAAKGWLDLIPVALDIGSQIYEILSKSAGPSITKSVGAITETTMPSAATKGTTKEIVPSFSDEVLKAVGGNRRSVEDLDILRIQCC